MKPIARKIRERLPHVQKMNAKQMYCWRLYGLKPHFRLCIIDWTVTRFFTGKPEYRRIRLFGWTVYERNREWSGLPVNAR